MYACLQVALSITLQQMQLTDTGLYLTVGFLFVYLKIGAIFALSNLEGVSYQAKIVYVCTPVSNSTQATYSMTSFRV